MSHAGAAFAFTRACMAIAKMYADILVVNRRETKSHFPIADLKKPLVDLIYLGRAFDDNGLSDRMRMVWAEVIANEFIDKSAKEYNVHYHIDTTELQLPQKTYVVNHNQNPGQRAMSH
jgi:hypothetical protein